MKKVIMCIVIGLIIATLGVGGFFVFDNFKKEKNRTSELENKIATMEAKSENSNSNEIKSENNEDEIDLNDGKKESRIQTYESLKGTYESQDIILNEESDDEPMYMNYTIILSEEGTFAAYYKLGDTANCRYIGYYTIDNNQIVMHSVVLTGNDTSAKLNNEILKFTLNNDGTFGDNENNVFSKKSSTPREDTNIANIIDYYISGFSKSGHEEPSLYRLEK